MIVADADKSCVEVGVGAGAASTGGVDAIVFSLPQPQAARQPNASVIISFNDLRAQTLSLADLG